MKFLKKMIAILAIALTLNICFTNITLADDHASLPEGQIISPLYAQYDQDHSLITQARQYAEGTITKHEPEFQPTKPPIENEKLKPDGGKPKDDNNWLWIVGGLLILVAVGAGISMSGGGGDDSGGNPPTSTPSSSTGSVTINW